MKNARKILCNNLKNEFYENITPFYTHSIGPMKNVHVLLEGKFLKA